MTDRLAIIHADGSMNVLSEAATIAEAIEIRDSDNRHEMNPLRLSRAHRVRIEIGAEVGAMVVQRELQAANVAISRVFAANGRLADAPHLSDAEVNLLECALGIRASDGWGAWVSEAMEYLQGRGLLSRSPNVTVTVAGCEALLAHYAGIRNQEDRCHANKKVD